MAAAVVKKEPRRELEGQAGVQLGITVTKNSNDFSDWYSQVLIKGEMLDYYDISGCYILKPWSYGIWQEIQGEAVFTSSPCIPLFPSIAWLTGYHLIEQDGSMWEC